MNDRYNYGEACMSRFPDYDYVHRVTAKLYCTPILPNSDELESRHLLDAERNYAGRGGNIVIEGAYYIDDKICVDINLDVGFNTSDVMQWENAEYFDPPSTVYYVLFRALDDFDRLHHTRYVDRIKDYACVYFDTIVDISDCMKEEFKLFRFLKPLQNTLFKLGEV